MKNIAFIDAQNLRMGTLEDNWEIDYKKFRVYLKDKYKVEEAYYFIGWLNPELRSLYTNLQKSGFILVFRDHLPDMKGLKKGNVDTDIVFEIMKNLIECSDDFNKIMLISGDGDYKKTVDYLILKKKFGKILFPNSKFASSLYKKLSVSFYSHLNQQGIKDKIEFKKVK